MHVQAQRWLQQSLEQHGRYITSLIERQNAGNTDPIPPPQPFVFPPQHGAAAGLPPIAAMPSQPPSSAAAPDGGQTSHVAFPGSPTAAQQGGHYGGATASVPAAAVGAFNAAATEPSDADLLEAPREQHQPVDGPLEGATVAGVPSKVTIKAELTAAPLHQHPVDAS
jgi:hypothetical protein